ncbi:flocculation protein FLO11 [Rosa sericea]
MAQLERPQRHGDAETTMTSDHKKLAVNPTMEHYLRGTEFSRSSPTSLSSPVGSHDAEEDHNHHPKKSVLTKVKEKAKKLKHSLSYKKKHHDNDSHETDNITPSWSANLNDNEEEEEDAEYLGAPMYKSEMAPEGYRDTAKLATPVVSEKRVLSSSVNQSSEQNKELQSPSSNQIVAESAITKLPNEIFTGIVLTRTLSTNEKATGTTATKPHSLKKTVSETNSPHKPHSPSKTVTETGATKTPSPKKTITETVTEKLGAGYATVSEKLGTGYATVSEKLGTGYNTASEKLGTGYNAASEKLGPAYATVTDATHAIASKIESLTVSPPVTTTRENLISSHPDLTKIHGLTVTAPPPSQSITAQEAPQALSASAAEHKSSTRAALEDPQPSSAPAAPGKTTAEQRWDKGVSVKEYLIQKFEPGEDERALSQVISDVMSPRKSPGEAGVVEKVKGAITSLLRNDESPRTTTSQSALSSSPRIPISTNAYEVVEEENQGRILQAN